MPKILEPVGRRNESKPNDRISGTMGEDNAGNTSAPRMNTDHEASPATSLGSMSGRGTPAQADAERASAEASDCAGSVHSDNSSTIVNCSGDEAGGSYSRWPKPRGVPRGAETQMMQQSGRSHPMDRFMHQTPRDEPFSIYTARGRHQGLTGGPRKTERSGPPKPSSSTGVVAGSASTGSLDQHYISSQ